MKSRLPSRGTLDEGFRGSKPRDCCFFAVPELLTFTADVERSPCDGSGKRHLVATQALLDLLDETGARGTFFVLGEVAEAAPWLVREIASRGHELASHGHRHEPLEALSPAILLADAMRARAVLQDLSGQPVPGFRAPYFSLTPSTEWATEALAEAGYAYSSSVLPARGFLHGHPAAPRRPFAWSSGLLEIPVPVARLGPMTLPPLGGMYLRYLASWDLARMARRLEGPMAWTYCHPYDLDSEEPFGRAPGMGLASSFFLWANRGVTARRLRALLRGRLSLPFAERLAEARAMAGMPEPAALSPSPSQSKGSAEETTVVSDW
jgi:polysaccharide deacetylase family protein (PEP-CTERM system associated)